MMGYSRVALARRRELRGLSQRNAAQAAGVNFTTYQKWESGLSSPYPNNRRRLAQVLDVTLHELDALLGGETTAARGHERGHGVEAQVVRASIPGLRRALDRLDLPDDGPTRPVAALRKDVAVASDDRLQAHYADLAEKLPDLVHEVARACLTNDADERRRGAGLMTLLLRAADGVAFKFGYLDLSARLIDLMRAKAEQAEDRLLLAAVAYVRTETFFASRDLDAAARALELAIDGARNLPTTGGDAALGALHMRAAVVAGRSGKHDQATEHLAHARYRAAVVAEGVYQGTAFGAASLRIHELAVAAELHDVAGIRRAATWAPPGFLPAERRSHYYIDLARAQLHLGRHGDSSRSLRAARGAAPEHTRGHPQVRTTLTALLDEARNPGVDLLELAEWIGPRTSAFGGLG
jgi:transcriptional regulator with XRE-family HTH domain